MSVHDFKEQVKIEISDSQLEDIYSLETISYKDIKDLNDENKYNWVQIGTDKYGRFMYCTKTKIKRSQTMGEFYGTGVID